MKQDKVVSQVLGDEIALSPSDLLNQQFKRAAFGGYQRPPVDDFIERVADVLEGLINQVRQLKEKNEEQRRTIADYVDMEQALRNTLIDSQQHGNQMLDAARREAHVIVEEAKLKRAQAQADATKLPTVLARDIHLLEQQRSRLRVELLAILETHRKLIDSLVPDDRQTTPVGFFEVGGPPGLTSSLPPDFAEEPATAVVADLPETAGAPIERKKRLRNEGRTTSVAETPDLPLDLDSAETDGDEG